MKKPEKTNGKKGKVRTMRESNSKEHEGKIRKMKGTPLQTEKQRKQKKTNKHPKIPSPEI